MYQNTYQQILQSVQQIIFTKKIMFLFSKAKYKWILKNYDNFFDYYSENFNGSWRDFLNLEKEQGFMSQAQYTLF